MKIAVIAILAAPLLWFGAALVRVLQIADRDVRAEPRNTAVVVDSWWSADYAKSGCEQAESFVKENGNLINQLGCEAVTACTDVMPRFTACTTGLDPAVAGDSQTTGVTFVVTQVWGRKPL